MSVFFVSWPSKVIHRKLTSLLVEEFLGPVFSIELVDRWRAAVDRWRAASPGVRAFDQVQVAYKLRTAFLVFGFHKTKLNGNTWEYPPH